MTRLKLENIFLFLLCWLRQLYVGKADKNNGTPHSILVVQLAKMGDMVCTTPVFRAIKKKYPTSALYVIGNAINKELLEGNTDIDHYAVYEDNFFAMLGVVKKMRADFACLVTPSFKMLALLYLAGIPVIAAPKIAGGASPYETRTYKKLLHFVIPIPHRMGSYAPREYLKLLAPIDVFSDDTVKHLSFSERAQRSISDFFVKNGVREGSDFVVAVAPSCGNKIKQWGSNKFAQLAQFLQKKYNAKIIIIGGSVDKAEAREMIHFLAGTADVINTAGFFNLDELKALLARVHLLVSVDSGPIYIAEAFGTATVDIVGPIDEHEQPPTGSLHKIVYWEERKRPELYVMNARIFNEAEAKRQVDLITVEMVTEKIDEIMPLLAVRRYERAKV